MMLSAIWGGVLAAGLGYVVSGWPGALVGLALGALLTLLLFGPGREALSGVGRWLDRWTI
ncbi:hypothetical protein [Methylobacterium aquaticum]|jgi:hypothetical protein|uniref:Uncharacterized protein n=1 Tax=Methylobacterium aquaticum TaxID=270351 RepID=A0A0J6S1P7_9HYPH|nr:hypothetical protein [Methylobacterium aquaticum]KMO27463.1 hypothetical protein VP06_30675 [Methylobacterium aquaticum]